MSGDQLIAALPKEMTTGLDLKEFGEILVRYRDFALSRNRRPSTSPPPSAWSRASSLAACSSPTPNITGLHDTSIVGS